jgi:hypothetical protein
MDGRGRRKIKMNDLLVSLLKRSPALLVLLGLNVFFFYLAVANGGAGFVGTIAFMLLGFAAMISAAIVVAYPIATFLAEPFARLYMPKGEVVPPPLYYLVEKYELEGRIGEALTEYQKILHYHPQEYPAHEGRMKLAIHGLRDVELARKYYRESQARLKNLQARADLEAAWREMFPKGEI